MGADDDEFLRRVASFLPFHLMSSFHVPLSRSPIFLMVDMVAVRPAAFVES